MPGVDRQIIGRTPTSGSRRPARVDPIPTAQVAAATGTAIAGAAKVGRLLSRSGWGLARRLPGGQTLQREVERFQDVALNEVRRLLDPAEAKANGNGTANGRAANHEEQRVMMLVQQSNNGHDPLRSAMSELLERSVESDRNSSRDYLYGNIISQLVPDEARILAALADGSTFAAIDVVAKQVGRSATRTVLANISTVGRMSGVSLPDNTATYVTRLYRFGLVDFAPPAPALSTQFDILAADSAVQAAEATIEARRQGSPKLIRKTLTLSQFGHEFWAACDPSVPGLPRGSA